MIIAFIILCVILYWVGGEKWAHTLFRDIGCSLCILAVAVLLLGFHWSLLLIVPIAWAGFSLGDYGKWQWSVHAFVVSLCMYPFAIQQHFYVQFIVMSVAVTLGTYLTSRLFSNKWMADVWCRALLYATIPLWFLLP